MSQKTNEVPKPTLPETPDPATTKNRLEKLKVAFETGQDVMLITNLLEQYLENTQVIDGKLPEEIPLEQMTAMMNILKPEDRERLIGILKKPSPGATASAYPSLDYMKGVIEQGMNSPLLKPLVDKFETIGGKKSALMAGLLAALTQVLLTFKNLPGMQGYAAEIALGQASDSIANDKLLSSEQKAERMKAVTTEEGRRHFMVAFDDWVAKGTPANRKPGSAAFLAPTAAPAAVAQTSPATPLVAVPTTPVTTPALGDRVEGKRTVTPKSGTPFDITRGIDNKIVLMAAGTSAEASIPNLNIANVFTTNAAGNENAKVTLELADKRTIVLDAETLRSAVQKREQKLMTADGFTIELKTKTA